MIPEILIAIQPENIGNLILRRFCFRPAGKIGNPKLLNIDNVISYYTRRIHFNLSLEAFLE
jgi:hypothetical protein